MGLILEITSLWLYVPLFGIIVTVLIREGIDDDE